MFKIVTIIVPIYNAEKYLHKCIESILAQTYTDFELLLINDGSKDNSGAICEEYATKDSRVRVFHKENGGASAARNCGLDNAIGEYICFIDADDWVDEDYIEKLLPTDGTEMTVCSIKYEGKNNNYTLPLWHKDYNNKNLCESLNYIVEHMAVCSPSCKIMKRDIIERNNIRFDTKVSAGEDMLFIYDYIAGIQKMRTISFPLYHYNVVETSLSHKVVPIDTTYYIMDALRHKLNKIGEKFNWECSHALKGMSCTQLFNMLAYVKQEKHFLTKIKLLNKILRNNNIRYLLYDRDYIIKRRQYSVSTKMILSVILFFYKCFY